MADVSNKSYSCGGKKFCAVFGQEIFSPTNLLQRKGHNVDVSSLKTFFTSSDVDYIHEDFPINSENQFKTDLNKVKSKCKEDDVQILVIVILSHGGDNYFYAKDGSKIHIYPDFIGELTKMEDNGEPFMNKKPKLVLIQACRGNKLMTIEVDDDCGKISDAEATRIEIHAHDQAIVGKSSDAKEVGNEVQVKDEDLLIAYSTVNGCLSIRTEEHGTVFINFLCKIFTALHKSYDVVSMLCLVNQLMTERIEIDAEINKTKDVSVKIMSNYKSKLTKNLYLSQCPSQSSSVLSLPLKDPIPFEVDFFEGTLPIPGLKICFSSKCKEENICIIISQCHFDDLKEGWRGYDNKKRMAESFVDKDTNRLVDLFEELNFLVLKKKNWNCEKIKLIRPLLEGENINIEKIKCLVVVMLTNGEGKKMWANGSTMGIQELKSSFTEKKKKRNTKMENLARIPKIFIVLACGVKKLDDLANEDKGGDCLYNQNVVFKHFCPPKDRIPNESNVSMIFSSCCDKLNEGTKFIEALCNEFKTNHKTKDVVGMFTAVNGMMQNDQENSGKCLFVSRLTGLVFLTNDLNKMTKPNIFSDNQHGIMSMSNEAYSCNGRKLLIVFNQARNRESSRTDLKRLKRLFCHQLAYEVYTLEDLTKDKIQKYITEIRNRFVEKDIVCLVVVVLSHGDRTNIFDVDDVRIPIRDFVESFADIDKTSRKPFMHGKPKLFIIESSRTNNKSEMETRFIHNLDTLTAYACVPGCCAFRHGHFGSFFIYYLCEMFQAYHDKYDVATILTMVNNLMAKQVHIKAIKMDKTNVDINLLSCFESHFTKAMYLSDIPTKSSADLPESICFDNVLTQTTVTIKCPEIFTVSNNKWENLCMIFNYTKFSANKCKDGWRGVTDSNEYEDHDAERLEMLYKKLNFEVLVKTNCDFFAFDNVMQSLEQEFNLQKLKCLVVFVLSNGVGGCIQINDDKIKIQNLKKKFNTISSKIPKLFFVLACNGKNNGDDGDNDEYINYDKMRNLEVIEGKTDTLAKEANVLVMYSSCTDRGVGKGTIFVDKLCNEVETNYTSCDVMTMLTKINQMICEDKQSKGVIGEKKFSNCWIISSLTGRVFLTANKKDQLLITGFDSNSIDERSYQNLINIFNNSQKFEIIKMKQTTSNDEEFQKLIQICQDESFQSKWLIFIGPASQFGSGQNDKFNKIVKELQKSSGNTFLVIFTYPDQWKHGLKEIRISEFLSEKYKAERGESLLLHDYMSNELLQKLNNQKKINHFILSVPISIVSDEGKSIVNVFINNLLESSVENHHDLLRAMKNLKTDLYKMGLKGGLSPVCKVDSTCQ